MRAVHAGAGGGRSKERGMEYSDIEPTSTDVPYKATRAYFIISIFRLLV